MQVSVAMDLTGKRVSAARDVLVRELKGESVLLHLDSESYFGLDEVGASMWRALVGSASVEEAIDLLLGEYDVGRDDLVRDLHAFVDKLSGAGLVEIHGR